MEPPRNPFEAPRVDELGTAPPTTDDTLADPGARLLASVVDGGLSLLCFFPCMAALADEDLLVGMIGVSVLLLVGLGIYNMVLLTQRGQTIGKRAAKVRVVRTNGQPADFVHAVLLRAIVMGLAQGVLGGCGSILGLVDVLFIFREDRRCIHDHLADTKVVVAESD